MSAPPPVDPLALIDHIVATHHLLLRRELPRLEAFAAVCADLFAGRPHVAELHVTARRLHGEAGRHLDTEELVLFPAVRRGVAAARPNGAGLTMVLPTTSMAAEHADVAALATHALDLARLARDDLGAAPAVDALCAGLAALVADLGVHQHLEDEVLFPAVNGVPADPGFGSTTFC